MSEDVDFKLVPTPGAPISRNGLRRQRSALRDRVTAALQAADFAFDPKDAVRSRDENGYTIYQLPYTAGQAGQGLRSTIQIEIEHTVLRLPGVTLPVSSFVAEAQASHRRSRQSRVSASPRRRPKSWSPSRAGPRWTSPA